MESMLAVRRKKVKMSEVRDAFSRLVKEFLAKKFDTTIQESGTIGKNKLLLYFKPLLELPLIEQHDIAELSVIYTEKTTRYFEGYVKNIFVKKINSIQVENHDSRLKNCTDWDIKDVWGCKDKTNDRVVKFSYPDIFVETLNTILTIVKTEQLFLAAFFCASKEDELVQNILGKQFQCLFKEFEKMVDKAVQSDAFNALHLIYLCGKGELHYKNDEQHQFIYSILTKLQIHLKMSFGKFIEDEVKWIQKFRQTVKQQGILTPLLKYPEFILNVENVSARSIPQLYDMIDSTCIPLIHKLTTELFKWLDKTAKSDPKYVDVCLMENYKFFYSVFKPSILNSVQQYVKKAQQRYKKRKQRYVQWSLSYEMEDLMLL
eukprot:UN06560